MVGAARALIADDESALRADLERLLADMWPELGIVASVGDGAAALDAMECLRPDVAFLDIRMPPPSGLDVARRAGADTAVVLVTAYDSHAVEAFERAAVVYLLKPVLGSRLQETVGRLKRWLAGGNRSGANPRILESLIRRLADTPAYLHWLRVGQGERGRARYRRRRLLLPIRPQVHRGGDARPGAPGPHADHGAGSAPRPRAVLANPPRPHRQCRRDQGCPRDLRGRYRLTLKERPEVLRAPPTDTCSGACGLGADRLSAQQRDALSLQRRGDRRPAACSPRTFRDYRTQTLYVRHAPGAVGGHRDAELRTAALEPRRCRSLTRRSDGTESKFGKPRYIPVHESTRPVAGHLRGAARPPLPQSLQPELLPLGTRRVRGRRRARARRRRKEDPFTRSGHPRASTPRSEAITNQTLDFEFGRWRRGGT